MPTRARVFNKHDNNINRCKKKHANEYNKGNEMHGGHHIDNRSSIITTKVFSTSSRLNLFVREKKSEYHKQALNVSFMIYNVIDTFFD